MSAQSTISDEIVDLTRGFFLWSNKNYQYRYTYTATAVAGPAIQESDYIIASASFKLSSKTMEKFLNEEAEYGPIF